MGIRSMNLRRNNPFGGRPLRMESLEEKTVLAAVIVSSDADSGPDTLREAIESANADDTISMIKVLSSVGTIELDSSLEYTGTQRLTISGGNAVVRPSAGNEQVFDLFVSSAGADLFINRIGFEDGLQGIHVPVPVDVEGTIKLMLNEVNVSGSGRHGVFFDDQTNESPASVYFRSSNSSFIGNGVNELDFDGIRVQEGGEGDIDALLNHTIVDANGGDGLELDERGEGDVNMRVVRSTFNENGFFNVADLDDGLDIDEADDGDINAYIFSSEFNDNLDEGLDLDEENEGSVKLKATSIVANNNNDEGIKIDEEEDGSVEVQLFNVEANGSKDEEGIAIEELGEGDFTARFVRVTANGNDKDGIDLTEEDNGSLNVRLLNVEASENGNHGLKLEEVGEGDLEALAVLLTANENDEFGIEAEQDTVGGDEGTLNLFKAELIDNVLGEYDLTDVLIP